MLLIAHAKLKHYQQGTQSRLSSHQHGLFTIEFFTIMQSWQCSHYCQPCILIYLQLPAPFAPIGVSKCEIRNQEIYENYILQIQSLLDDLILKGTAVADPGFGQGGGAKNFFPRFCRRSKAKSGKESKQYNISI